MGIDEIIDLEPCIKAAPNFKFSKEQLSVIKENAKNRDISAGDLADSIFREAISNLYNEGYSKELKRTDIEKNHIIYEISSLTEKEKEVGVNAIVDEEIDRILKYI